MVGGSLQDVESKTANYKLETREPKMNKPFGTNQSKIQHVFNVGEHVGYVLFIQIIQVVMEP